MFGRCAWVRHPRASRKRPDARLASKDSRRLAAIAGLALLGSVGLIPVAAPPANPASASQLAQAPDPVIATAGDIACDPSNSNFNGGNGAANSCRQMYTSNLLVGANLAAVLDLGDNQYYCGGYQAFLQSYGPSWGRVKSITYPAVGNHEYLTSGGTDCTPANAGAAGYFAYFGAAAGQPGQGYYSYDIGTWHIIALNSNCGNAGGCGATSPQGIWLANDLKTHANFCTLAYWHIPLFSSGGRANNNSKTFWQLLYDNNADLILSAHDHTYERFAPQTPSGSLDTSRGIREFIVGSGGANHTSFVTIAANSEVRNASSFGVLEITLHPTSYDWQFVPEAGQTFTDSGTTACHGATSDTTPPTAPANLTAMASSPTQVNLTWSASSDDVGVTGYKVYRNGVFLASSATTSYSDTTAQAATTYSYTVYAYDAAGNISPASNTATVTTPNQGDTQPPSTPDGLTATAATASQVNLAWSAATDDVGVAGYTIYRNGAAIATTSGPNATTYTDVSVAPSTTYTYTVDAFDAAGNRSPQSAGASVTTPPSNIHTITLNPTADTYIDSANPTVNHGTSAQLRVDGSPLVYSFLKFDLSAVPGTVTGLTLNVYATSSSGAGYAVRSVADNSWSESTLTWNNAPPIGTSDAGQSGAFAANTLTTVNVSSLSNGNGMLSMAMLGINSTAIAFSSREGTVKPQLVVSYQS